MAKLLVRDLRQVVSPAGRHAPLRGQALADLDWTDDGYVLCDGPTIEAVGRMRDLGPLDGDVLELDGRGLCAVPGLVDCHTHPAFGGDRVEEFSLRAAGASYEELHAAGGGILSTVRATREAGEDGLRAAVERHRNWMRRAGTTTFEGKSGYGLDRDTELASLAAIRAAGGVPTYLGAHAVPPEHADPDAYLDFVIADVLPEAAKLAEAADVFLERGAFDAAQARRYLEAARGHGLELRLHGDQFTEAAACEIRELQIRRILNKIHPAEKIRQLENDKAKEQHIEQAEDDVEGATEAPEATPADEATVGSSEPDSAEEAPIGDAVAADDATADESADEDAATGTEDPETKAEAS